MRRFRVKVTRTAERDISEIFRFIASDKESAAAAWVAEMERHIDSLERFPLRCQVIPESRELGREYRPIVQGDYRTVFRIAGSNVVIMRVIHGCRLLSMRLFEK